MKDGRKPPASDETIIIRRICFFPKKVGCRRKQKHLQLKKALLQNQVDMNLVGLHGQSKLARLQISLVFQDLSAADRKILAAVEKVEAGMKN